MPGAAFCEMFLLLFDHAWPSSTILPGYQRRRGQDGPPPARVQRLGGGFPFQVLWRIGVRLAARRTLQRQVDGRIRIVSRKRRRRRSLEMPQQQMGRALLRLAQDVEIIVGHRVSRSAWQFASAGSQLRLFQIPGAGRASRDRPDTDCTRPVHEASRARRLPWARPRSGPIGER